MPFANPAPIASDGVPCEVCPIRKASFKAELRFGAIDGSALISPAAYVSLERVDNGGILKYDPVLFEPDLPLTKKTRPSRSESVQLQRYFLCIAQ